MRHTLLILSLLTIFTKCSNQGLDIDKIKNNFGETEKQYNDSVDKWEAEYKSLSLLSIDSPIVALNKIELATYSNNTEKTKLNDLLFLKGNIYYQIDSFEKSVETFSIIDNLNMSPKYLAARAGAYIKLKSISKSTK